MMICSLRYNIFFAVLCLCIVWPGFVAEEQCIINQFYTQKGFTEDKPQLFIAYLSKESKYEEQWRLCASYRASNVPLTCAPVQFTEAEAKPDKIRLFVAKTNAEYDIYVAVYHSNDKMTSIYTYHFENGKMDRKGNVGNVKVNSLMDLTMSKAGLYNSKDCKILYPENSDISHLKDDCCKSGKDEYCLYDIEMKKSERVPLKDELRSIFVFRCNYYFEQVFREPSAATTYVSHMSTLKDFNQVYCFKGSRTTAQFIMLDVSETQKDQQSCKDIDLKAMKVTVIPQLAQTAPPDRQVIRRTNETTDVTPTTTTTVDEITPCFNKPEFLVAASVDCILLITILVIIVLAQMGVHKKNKGRIRAKWYKRRPRFRRRHRRHGKGGVSTYTTMTNMSQVQTGMTAPESQMTQGGTSYYN